MLVGIFQCFSQTSTYIGKGKMYKMTGGYYDYVYHATIPYTYSTLYSEEVPAEKLTVWKGDTPIEYSSVRGNYIEFQLYHNLSGGYGTSRQFIFPIRFYKGLYAFVQEGKSLCVVNIENDSILMVLDSNFQRENDFSITVVDKTFIYGERCEPQIFITNNGYVTKFDDISSNVTSISSIVNEKTYQSKKYTLGGVEITEPQNGIYIQDGKKILKKQ